MIIGKEHDEVDRPLRLSAAGGAAAWTLGKRRNKPMDAGRQHGEAAHAA
jgi:hypothetical protein